MYKWQRIKALHAQGVSIRQIARTVNVNQKLGHLLVRN